MSGGAAPQPPVKEPTSLTFQFPILTSTNYTIWRMRMEVLLGIHGVWDVIDPGSDDAKKNNIVKGFLFQSIPEDVILQIGNLKTAKEMWDAIKTRNLGADRVKEARLQTLTAEFESMKMAENGTLDEYAAKISGIASKSATLGEVMAEEKLVKKFLTSLPRRFVHIVAALEQVLDLKTIGFEDVVGRLKTYEERIRGEDKVIETQGNLLYSKTEPSNRNRDSSRGRGRGLNIRGRGRGGGRGRGNTQNHGYPEPPKNREDQKGKPREQRDLSNIRCYRCDKYGHFVSRCPDRIKNHEANLNETQEGDINQEEETFFMMNAVEETVFLNEAKYIPPTVEPNTDEDGVWYLDNGASNHMTGNYSYFSELNERITGRVRFGDGSCVAIKGKGSILFEGKNGEQKLLKDVYYIPSLRSNVISLGQTTIFGCDIRMRGDFLTMRDGDGRLLMKVPRSENRLYKIQLKIGKPHCLQVKINEAAWLWHARLGHINFGAINLMHKLAKGVPAIQHQDQLCESCMVGKQTKQSFSKRAEYRATNILEMVHGDICGPVDPPTQAGNSYILVLIDDYSRYMWSFLLKHKSDASGVIKRFKRVIEKRTGKEIKTFHTDRGGEFTSHELNRFCDEEGISRMLTAPYAPQQNGIVERRNRTLLEMTRCLMKAKGVPNYLWGEAVRHATFIINRTPTRALVGVTPYEKFYGEKPNLEDLKVFGCIAYDRVVSKHLKKLDDRSKPLVYLGKEPNSGGFRLYLKKNEENLKNSIFGANLKIFEDILLD
ncbi:hypothetical protein OSB04_001954 [Centaurea solstitialis]|uniref:Uncharacterized protein n=1 Tax=Centaurea solstitialis TaxID=347529 RepID=A0AA38UAN8_9ASTR|nr:hypothetical protein OSB04_001954 [Centaurea solstitialis]